MANKIFNKIPKKTILESYRDIAKNQKPLDKDEEEILDGWSKLKSEDIKDNSKMLSMAKQAQKNL